MKINKQRGQGLSEYIIIVALIAIASIGVVGFFGDTIGNQIAAMSQELAGQDGTTAIGSAGSAADAAVGVGESANQLGTYGGQASDAAATPAAAEPAGG